MSGILFMWMTYVLSGALVLGFAWVFRTLFEWKSSRQRDTRESPDSRDV
jgi:hypothetical protein